MFSTLKNLRIPGDPARPVSPCIILKGEKYIKEERRWRISGAGCADLEFYSTFALYLEIYCTFVHWLKKNGCPSILGSEKVLQLKWKLVRSRSAAQKSTCIVDPWSQIVPKTKWKQMRLRFLARRSGCTFDPWTKKEPKSNESKLPNCL